MVISQPTGDSPIYRQTNSGPGTFIGGNNYGTVETMDGRTKAVLNKLASEAPGLAKLLTRALHDGVISTEAVFAMEMAARNLNWDVAEALYTAGRNINPDVAQMLSWAGDNINAQVAEKLSHAANQFEAFSNDLYQTQAIAQSLVAAVAEIRGFDGHVTDIKGASQDLAMAASRFVPTSEWSFKSFLWGMFSCLILVTMILGFYASTRP